MGSPSSSPLLPPPAQLQQIPLVCIWEGRAGLVPHGWGWRMRCEMQSQLLPCGMMHLQAVTVPPLVTSTPGITGNQGKFLLLSPSAPRVPVPFMHRLFTASTVLVICWHFVVPCPLLKIPHGAVGGCLVLLEPCTWPDPPLGSQRSWDMEVWALLPLLSYVAVKVLAPDCSVHHLELVWRSISCICFFNCPIKCAS